jgi:transcriptional regulator with PAS, ATPase and Fis domain
VSLPDTAALPLDAARVLELAAKSFFDTFARTAMGTMVVDRSHRIVWIDDGYRRFLPALGHAEHDFVGRRVEEVVPNTLMGQVIDSGQAILVDLLSNQAGTFLVTRLPLRNEAGEVIGAVGFVLLDHPETTMQPLIAKFAALQGELDRARAQLADERAAQRRPRHTIASFIGSSAAAMALKNRARRVAPTDSTVLLLGETGTGKELLAHGIHRASRRAAGPFVGVNIAAVPEGLLEAEFFGAAPGAYTGADRKGRAGKFRVADGGTLFLDEIGDMPLPLQSKLLRALQEQEIEPLGADRVESVDVRIIAATSRDLAAMVAEGRFRADLYYRLNVLPLRLPPLRERLDDLDALVESLMDDIARRSQMLPRSVSAEALAWLASRPWPGNIRELRNVLEQATLMSDDLVLEPRHLGGAAELSDGPEAAVLPGFGGAAPGALLPRSRAESGAETVAELGAGATHPGAPAPGAAGPPGLLRPLAEQLAEVEHRALRTALLATGGNRVAAARLLKMSRAAFYDRLARWPELARMHTHVV